MKNFSKLSLIALVCALSVGQTEASEGFETAFGQIKQGWHDITNKVANSKSLKYFSSKFPGLAPYYQNPEYLRHQARRLGYVGVGLVPVFCKGRRFIGGPTARFTGVGFSFYNAHKFMNMGVQDQLAIANRGIKENGKKIDALHNKTDEHMGMTNQLLEGQKDILQGQENISKQQKAGAEEIKNIFEVSKTFIVKWLHEKTGSVLNKEKEQEV